MWNYFLLFIIFLLVAYIWVKHRVEFFEDHYPGYNSTLQYSNAGEKLYERHPVYSTIQEDLKLKYKKAYNYELENEAYQKALVDTFQIKKSCINDKDWSIVEPVSLTVNPLVEEAYRFTVEYIEGKVKTSDAFQLPDRVSIQLNPIQVVHDRLISYQLHKKIPSFILNLEVVLYREAKYHAKAIGMTVKAEKTKGGWSVQVLDAWINGVVFEDQLALFPVVGNDVLNTNQNLSNATFPEPKFPQRLQDVRFPEYCASNNLDKNQQIQCVQAIDLRSLPDEFVQEMRKNPNYV